MLAAISLLEQFNMQTFRKLVNVLIVRSCQPWLQGFQTIKVAMFVYSMQVTFLLLTQ